jgi:hypothetical protein
MNCETPFPKPTARKAKLISMMAPLFHSAIIHGAGSFGPCATALSHTRGHPVWYQNTHWIITPILTSHWPISYFSTPPASLTNSPSDTPSRLYVCRRKYAPEAHNPPSAAAAPRQPPSRVTSRPRSGVDQIPGASSASASRLESYPCSVQHWNTILVGSQEESGGPLRRKAGSATSSGTLQGREP